MNKLKLLPIMGLAMTLIACGKEPSKNETGIQLPNPISEAHAETTQSATPEHSDGKAGILRPSYEACIDKTDGSDALMLDCIHDETAFQDKQLKVTYKKALSLLDADGKAKLVVAQKAWLAFTEADWNFDFAAGGEGAAVKLTADEAYLNQLVQRVESLNGTVEMLQIR